MKRDIYQEVTDTIIQSLESGTVPWRKPWSAKKSKLVSPTNVISQETYNGVNIPLLWATQHAKGYESQQWLSFKQAQALGGSVKKGEKSSTIVYFKMIDPKDSKDPEKRIPYLRFHPVFNLQQCDGLESHLKSEMSEARSTSGAETIETIDNLIKSTCANIRHIEQDRAYYSPGEDRITMPEKHQFENTDSYYSVLFHELTHWTGHKSRLNRESSKTTYAFEELVAELGSSFLSHEHKLDYKDQASAYIEAWLKDLKSDKKYIIKASTQAKKAVKFIKTGENN